MKDELKQTVRSVVENAYVRGSFGSVAIAESQREVALQRFGPDIEKDLVLLEALIEHEASCRATVVAADEPVLVLSEGM